MIPLTDRQLRVLVFLVEYRTCFGYPPTVREITKRFRWASTNAASDYLRALEIKGYIKRRPFASRAIQILKLPPERVPNAGGNCDEES